MSLRYKNLLLAGLLFFLPGCDNSADNLEKIKREYGDHPFSSEGWKAEKDRKGMVYDLIVNHHLCKKTENERNELLGKPDSYHKSEEFNAWEIFRNDEGRLLIVMNRFGKGNADQVIFFSYSGVFYKTFSKISCSKISL